MSTDVERREYNRLNRRRKREYITGLKSGPCIDCGGTFPPVCMDFDHVLKGKVKDISSMTSFSYAKIDAEIEKCVLRCANCHRIKTLTT